MRAAVQSDKAEMEMKSKPRAAKKPETSSQSCQEAQDVVAVLRRGRESGVIPA